VEEERMLSDISKIVGERIRHYRHKAGLSQDELAEKAELHGTYIGQLERGEKNATLESIEKVARALKLPLEALVENITTGADVNRAAVEGYNLINSLPYSEQEVLLDVIKRIVNYRNM
jgi:transcriptional regulator with XRE-family HTH domain